MTNLEKFRMTAAGNAIMGGAIFIAILSSPSLASLNDQDFVSPPQPEQSLNEPVEPTPPAFSTARLTEILEGSVEDLEAYAVDLNLEKSLLECHMAALKLMERLVDDVKDIFSVEATELSPAAKVSLIRRIVDNNLKVARKTFDNVGAFAEDVVEISVSPEELDVTPSTYAQLAANREEIMSAIDETKIDIDYIVDEIAKLRDENAYYREALQAVTGLFEKVLLARNPNQVSLDEDFAALKVWQKEFRAEMSTTDEDFSVSTR